MRSCGAQRRDLVAALRRVMRGRIGEVREGVVESFAPRGLGILGKLPTACAVGCILSQADVRGCARNLAAVLGTRDGGQLFDAAFAEAQGAFARSFMDNDAIIIGAPPAQFRIVLISFLAAGIGLLAGLVAYMLYKLIGLFTNLFFFHRWSTTFRSVGGHHLGVWVILVPVIGGLVVGVMAKYGTSKIKGHGIPEAMEAVLINRSRIEPKVAMLKPISAAIAIGTGGPFGAEGPIIQTGGALGRWSGKCCIRRRWSGRCCWLAARRRECRQRSILPLRA